MQVYKSDYVTVYFHEHSSILESIWTELSVEMTPSLIKRELAARLDLVQKHKPKALLNNAKKFYYRIPPDSQEWISKNVLQKYVEAGIRKSAYIISTDVIAQISIEQTIQEEVNRDYQIRYFDTKQQAFKWLVKKV